MKIDISNWKDYTLDALFIFKKGKRLTKEDMLEGDTNFIGSISENNGVRQKISAKAIFPPNCLTVNYNGSVGEAFYQAEPFWASDDVNVLIAKDFWRLNYYRAFFIITLIKANKFRFSYGRKWTLDKMKSEIIKLPIINNGEIDWDFIDSYIQQLNYKPISTKLSYNKISLDIIHWKDYKIGDFFKVERGKRIVRNVDYFTTPTDEYCYNVITSTKQNNGVDGYYNHYNCLENSIVCGGEAGGMFTTYQPKKCWVMDRARIFVPKRGVKINKYAAMFLATVFSCNEYKYSYGRTPNPKGIENTIIKLPEKNGNPNWDYMEEYIKSLPYSDRI